MYLLSAAAAHKAVSPFDVATASGYWALLVFGHNFAKEFSALSCIEELIGWTYMHAETVKSSGLARDHHIICEHKTHTTYCIAFT